MRRGFSSAFFSWLRCYSVSLAIFFILVVEVISVLAEGSVPVPAIPPTGQTIYESEVLLSWNCDSLEKKTTLSLSIDDPGFLKPETIETSSGFYNLRKLEPGKTYYWKVTIDGNESRTSYFNVSSAAVRFK